MAQKFSEITVAIAQMEVDNWESEVQKWNKNINLKLFSDKVYTLISNKIEPVNYHDFKVKPSPIKL